MKSRGPKVLPASSRQKPQGSRSASEWTLPRVSSPTTAGATPAAHWRRLPTHRVGVQMHPLQNGSTLRRVAS